MDKKCFFYIDDVIWLFRDLTRKRPASLFDNPFMSMLKKAHDDNGMKVQLNVFYRTDFFYGDDEFTLSEMTDAYQAEWEEASDWVKLGFHCKQEFPDYPYVNADYEDVRGTLELVKKEIARFAGEKSFAHGMVPHWMPISKDGCRAMYDGGIKIMAVSSGETREYNGDPSSLPYGHAFRLLNNRKPETKVYYRGTLDKAIDNSLCAYNHLSQELADSMKFNFDVYKDPEIGICFKKFTNANACLNLCTPQMVQEKLESVLGEAYVGYATHEQYFYEDYYAYQPDYAHKVYLASEIMAKGGYTYLFVEELAK